MNFNQKLHMQLISKFEDLLADLQKERKQRPESMDFHGQSLPAWAVYEINEMHNLVNQERKRLELEQCEIKKILRADSSAVGHSDYSHKFALYCAQIVQD